MREAAEGLREGEERVSEAEVAVRNGGELLTEARAHIQVYHTHTFSLTLSFALNHTSHEYSMATEHIWGSPCNISLD